MLSCGISYQASATIYDIYSGNGVIGGQDSEITFKQGPLSSPLPPLTNQDLTDAVNGDNAYIHTPHPNWITEADFANAGGNANAQWISSHPIRDFGFSALYTIAVNITDPSITSAVMDFYWAADNLLGDNVNAGVYLNDLSAPIATIAGGNFTSVSSAQINIFGDLTPGINRLFINVQNEGGPAGLIFSASILTNDDAPSGVPLPMPFYLMLAGLFGVLRKRIQ